MVLAAAKDAPAIKPEMDSSMLLLPSFGFGVLVLVSGVATNATLEDIGSAFAVVGMLRVDAAVTAANKDEDRNADLVSCGIGEEE
jgi:hypothetical protein